MEKNAEKKGVEKFVPIVGRIAFLIAIMFLAVYLITVLTASDAFFDDSSKKNALLSFNEDIEKAQNLSYEHYQNLYAIAERLQYASSKSEVETIIQSYIGSDDFGDLRYYSQGVAYAPDGSAVSSEMSGSELIEPLSKFKTHGCTRPYFDQTLSRDCMAFFVPVRGSDYIDGLIAIMPARNIIDLSGVINEKASAAILTDRSGKVLASYCREEFSHTVGNDICDFVAKITIDKNSKDYVTDALSAKSKLAFTVDTSTGPYIFTASATENLGADVLLFSVCEGEGLAASEMVYIRHIINLVVIAIVSLAIGLVYAIFYYRATQKKISEANYTDATVGCPNAEQFKNIASALLADRSCRYALAVFEIRQFRYLSENMSEEEVSDMLKFIAKILETFCGNKETYGYLGDGRFLLLIANAEERTMREKVRLIETMANKHAVLGENKSKKNFNVGISLAFELRRKSVSELIGHASVACETAKSNINADYIIYSEKANAEHSHDDKIEAEMESALENRDFRLFFQPKYNVAEDKIDSAEALVRWFDPVRGDYRFPGEFISLFETNGFIIKLDHFMYIEVLNYLKTSVEKGDKVVPVSVNVSLVTANSDDFLNFYISNKKLYGIADGYITLEFTESFAMGDSGKIRDIVNKLHDNGILCALDDFGTGYASFSVLKNIPIDELKLDRLFLYDGINKKNDDILLETVISLAKALGIRIAQEGVETKEMFDRVTEKGCGVIQGYYYAKAIPVEEYKIFVGSNTSIKFKSHVK